MLLLLLLLQCPATGWHCNRRWQPTAEDRRKLLSIGRSNGLSDFHLVVLVNPHEAIWPTQNRFREWTVSVWGKMLGIRSLLCRGNVPTTSASIEQTTDTVVMHCYMNDTVLSTDNWWSLGNFTLVRRLYTFCKIQMWKRIWWRPQPGIWVKSSPRKYPSRFRRFSKTARRQPLKLPMLNLKILVSRTIVEISLQATQSRSNQRWYWGRASMSSLNGHKRRSEFQQIKNGLFNAVVLAQSTSERRFAADRWTSEVELPGNWDEREKW